MSKVKVEAFVQDFVNELQHNNAAIFAGAGLSVAAGFVDWKGLLRAMAEELELDIERETDLVRVAQYHVNHHGHNRSDLTQAILDGFSRKTTAITENHRILSRLPFGTYWTTNYDTCIEDALKEAGKLPDVKHTPEHLLQTLHGRAAVVYKMHGDVSDAVNAVLSKSDYETYHLKRPDFLTALAGDLLSKTFLFLGFSFTDPNMDYVLGRLHTKYQGNQRKHYCFVRAESPNGGDRPGDFEYRRAKQEHFIKDLERYNIRAVMVEEYTQITEILRQVEYRYKSKTVFVSGAANDYGRAGEAAALAFVHSVGKGLIAENLRIITGLGLGIGSTVLDGALQQIYHVERTTLYDQIVIRPFPQSLQAKALWSAYRRDMLSYAGIALFMFGNKLAGTPAEVQISSGMIEEFEVAVSLGVKVLPLGFTGFAAKQLHDRVSADIAGFYPNATPSFVSHLSMLGDESRPAAEQVKTLFTALRELQLQ